MWQHSHSWVVFQGRAWRKWLQQMHSGRTQREQASAAVRFWLLRVQRGVMQQWRQAVELGRQQQAAARLVAGRILHSHLVGFWHEWL